MKKKKKIGSKLLLHKEPIANLNQIKGGDDPEITYTLSLGKVCKNSKAHTATNPYDCGLAITETYRQD